jgi:hypothetical protein
MKCNSASNSRRKFRRKFPRVQIPHRNTIQNLVSNVRTTSMLTEGKPKRHCQVLTEEKFDEIYAWLEWSPHKSLKCTKNESIKRDHKKCYKITETMALQDHS